MMHRLRIHWFVFCLFVPALTAYCSIAETGTQQMEAPKSNPAEDAIRALTKGWAMAWTQRDVAAIAEFYGEKPVVMPPGEEPIEDSAQLDAYLRRVTAGDQFSFSYRTREVRADGDFGVERGNYVLAFSSGSDGQVRTESGNLMRVVEKSSDGHWRIASEIWNIVVSSGSE